MQILINISRGIIDLLQSGRLQNGSIGARTILNAVSKGILLPERHEDLISKNCDNCKYKDKKYKEFPCIDCLEKDRYEEDGRMREATKEEREYINNYIKSISQKVITIPDGATNGDVRRAIFPCETVYELEDGIMIMGENKEYQHYYPKDRWNAPYEREGDENS